MYDALPPESPKVVTFGNLYKALRGKSAAITFPNSADYLAFRNLTQYVVENREKDCGNPDVFNWLRSVVMKETGIFFDEVNRLPLPEVWRIVEAAANRQNLHGGPPKKRKKRKRGGQKKYDAKTDRKLAADWKTAKQNGAYKADFARDHSLSAKDFDRLLNRVRSHKS